MNRTIVHLEQNTPAWEAWRQTRFGASDAAAMLGISPYKTREQLMREKQGAITKISDYQRELYAAGHTAEKAILPHLEDMAGQPITPLVYEGEDRIAASLDGINFEGTLIIEHKLLRDSDASRRRFNMAARGELDEHAGLSYRTARRTTWPSPTSSPMPTGSRASRKAGRSLPVTSKHPPTKYRKSWRRNTATSTHKSRRCKASSRQSKTN